MRRCETVSHNITVDWVLDFSVFLIFFFLFFPAYVVSLPMFHCLLSLFYSSQSFSLSLRQPPLIRLVSHSLQGFFTLMRLFFSLLSVFLSFPHLSSRYCTDGGQVLAGMIAEPAFLSEYTIFALDHSKRPQTAQVASVVSLSSLPASFIFLLLLLLLPRSFLPSSTPLGNR